MARMRPVWFSSTSAAPCTIGRTRSSARALLWPPLPLGVDFSLADADADDVVQVEGAPDAGAPGVERHDAAVGEADAHDLAVARLCLVHNDGGRPMHVVERQPRPLKRLQPHGLGAPAAAPSAFSGAVSSFLIVSARFASAPSKRMRPVESS